MLRPDEARVLLSKVVVGAIRCTPLAGGDYQIRFQSTLIRDDLIRFDIRTVAFDPRRKA
jgi:hypothetical protein